MTEIWSGKGFREQDSVKSISVSYSWSYNNMSLYFVFTIDGDWDEYFYHKLSRVERKPDKKTLLKLVKHEIKVASSINNKILHFIHTSPVARDFFLQPKFISLWKKMESGGGSVGVHYHADHLSNKDNLNNQGKIEESITFLTEELLEAGLSPISYRGGYLHFSQKKIPILEENGLLLDFSCDPGRHLLHEGDLVSDWRGAPNNYYRMSYDDYRKPGISEVIEIPLGKVVDGSLYIDTTSVLGIWKAARVLAKRDRKGKDDIIVFVLTHTYEFSSFWKRLKIKLALLICKKYGMFINDKEALGIIYKAEGEKHT